MADNPGVFLGKTIGNRYRIEELVGRGYFSFVYKAIDQQARATVAVKLLKLGHVAASDAVMEFDAEGRLLQSLSGKNNVVELYESGSSALRVSIGGASDELSIRFHAMDLADLALDDLLADRDQVDWMNRMRIYRDVVAGLHQMHTSFIVHRDLKSGNVLLFERGKRRIAAKVSDLGRSRDLSTIARFPASAYQHGRGDFDHAPPEHYLGLGGSSHHDFRYADLFLVGSVLCEVISGQRMNSLVLISDSTLKAFLAASAAHREAMFDTWSARAVLEYSTAISLISGEIPLAIRHQVVELLTQHCHPVPKMREQRQRREQNMPTWGLDWVLRRVDIILKRLEAAERFSVGASAQPGR